MHGKHKFHEELPAALFAQVEYPISARSTTHRHLSLSQKISVALFTFLLREQFIPRHTTPGRKILADSWISGTHFEDRPRLQAFHYLEHEQQETSATPLVSTIAHGPHGNLLPIPRTKHSSRHETVLHARKNNLLRREEATI